MSFQKILQAVRMVGIFFLLPIALLWGKRGINRWMYWLFD
jgi:hypothetical protein